MDEKKIEALAERLMGEVNAAMSCLTLHLGDRLGLFQALVDAGPGTATELAERTGLSERLLREWLECLAAGGYLEHDGETAKFSLPPEHAAVLVNRDHPAYSAALFYWVPSLAGVVEPLIEAFRSGGGVPYEAYGSAALEAIGTGNRPMFVNDYASKWIAAMPDVESRLRAGGRVAEIGCGIGWSSIALAQGFPSAHIDGVDLDKASIEQARRHAQQAGVADRVVFHLASAEEAPLEGPYDLVTAIECIHDMAYPVRALRRIRELAGADGTVLIADEAVGDTLEENSNFFGHLMYNFSVLHCLPQALVFPQAAGTGTVMRPSVLRRYAQEAGFTRFDVLPIENPVWRFYRLTP
ncbi:MAG: methyltransferase domain-containing protein [Chloroflexi bacterium]|nr:methyltransferase domain-containing protein [Chloroflexota bacterium]